MKAFEEWRNKTVNGKAVNAVIGRSYKADARVWRAALEWAKDEGICSGDSCVSSQFQVCGVKEVIEQELEGK
jgi:hypothetical protein